MRSTLRATGRDVVLKTLPAPVERLSRLVVLLVAAPRLGAASFGVYQLALTTGALLVSLTEVGVGLWTTRALARDSADGERIVSSGVRIRLLTSLPYAALLAVAALYESEADARRALVILGASSLLSSLVDYAGAILRGYEDFQTEAIVNLVRAALTTTAALVAVVALGSLDALAWGTLLGSVASAVVAAGLTARRLRSVPFAMPRARMRLTDMGLVPLWLSGLFSVLYFRCDVVLLHALTSDAEVGSYSAAYRIFEATTVLPSALVAVAFPKLARQAQGQGGAGPSERDVATVLFALGLVTGGALYLASDRLVALAFGAPFAAAAAPLRVLGCAAPFLFLNYALTSFLFARGLERRYVVIAAGLFVVNVVTNVALIPRWGGIGAAGVTFVCEALLALSALAALGAATPSTARAA